ncbi:MAG TPA: gamma-glutamyltransferase [Gemmatimonadaceae bacterium]|nr:gamma-glutamyltransferase [Gemmatimonadaceae bacterium]
MSTHQGGQAPVRAERFAVASPHRLASDAGLAALRRGGSAVDASIVMGAVLAAVYPHMTGLGGDGFWLVWDPRERRLHGLNGSGPAAALATRASYAEHGDAIPHRRARAALTVPGVVDGWRMLHERWGRLQWRTLFDDAIRHARDGAPVGRSLGHWLRADGTLQRECPEVHAVFHDALQPARAVDTRCVIPGLADTLTRLAERGPRAGFYEGETAERICASLASRGSPLRADDFAAFRAEWAEPLRTTYRGVTVCQLPPNSQGWTALSALNVLEGFDLSRWGEGSADYYHHAIEAIKLAFADRDAWLADPRFVHAPIDRLTAKDYASTRRSEIDPHRALPPAQVRAGVPFPGDTAHARPGGDTCYHCVVDADGMVVSAIESLFHDFASGVFGGDTGVLMQNRGSAFSLQANAANVLEPRKRPAHTLMPAMLLREGEPLLAFGAMGGEGQPQTHLALVTRIVDFGFDVQRAIDAPRWRYGRGWGDAVATVLLEGRIPQDVMEALAERGHDTRVVDAWSESMGHAHAIRIDRERGWLEAGADPRSDGCAAGD